MEKDNDSTVQSLGGKARAERLTKEERSKIAQIAAEARWDKVADESGGMRLPRATHQGELQIGNVKIPCGVLEDGTRVITQRGMFVALGMNKNPSRGQANAIDNRPGFLSANNLNPFISDELKRSWNPLPFRLPKGSGGYKGNIAFGYRAEILPLVCNTILDADDAGKLTDRQKHIVVQARILIRGLAHVGVVALVDEATGYQDERARDALAKILEAFIAKELRAWIRTFPSEFYRELFRLRGIAYREDVKRPQYIGHLTNDLVYARLAPGVLDELRRLTPRDEKGRLKNHLHRRLTEDLGHPKLLQHLSAVTALMKASETWAQFKPMVDKALPRYKHLPLFDGLAPKEATA